MWMAMLMAKGFLEDEDEKNPTLRLAVNMLYRVQQDLTFYMTPTTVEELFTRAVPVMAVGSDVLKAVNASVKYVVDDDYTWDKAALKWTKTIPVVGNINRGIFTSGKWADEN
jgi:hypothetical protein